MDTVVSVVADDQAAAAQNATILGYSSRASDQTTAMEDAMIGAVALATKRQQRMATKRRPGWRDKEDNDFF
jgi:hypothetical protein